MSIDTCTPILALISLTKTGLLVFSALSMTITLPQRQKILVERIVIDLVDRS